MGDLLLEAPRSALMRLLSKPSPLGGRWHGEAVTDEGNPRAEIPSYRYRIPCGPSSASFGGTFPQRGKA